MKSRVGKLDMYSSTMINRIILIISIDDLQTDRKKNEHHSRYIDRLNHSRVFGVHA